jgi:YidC/Oxa1 family membrane protein insertase
VAKVLTFKRGSYLIDVSWEIATGSDKAIGPARLLPVAAQ